MTIRSQMLLVGLFFFPFKGMKYLFLASGGLSLLQGWPQNVCKGIHLTSSCCPWLTDIILFPINIHCKVHSRIFCFQTMQVILSGCTASTALPIVNTVWPLLILWYPLCLKHTVTCLAFPSPLSSLFENHYCAPHVMVKLCTVANITSANSETESDCLLMVFASSCCSLLNTVVKHKLNCCCGILLQVSLIYVIPYPDFSKNKVYLYYFTSICIKKDSMTGMNTRC